MKVEFVNPFITSLKNVVGTMAMIELEVQKPKRKKNEVSFGDVSGIIGMVGPQVKGSMAITFDRDLAFNIMKNMLGDAATTIDEEVRDMVGEMTNMICGGAKNALSEQGYQFEMAVPVIISGANHCIQHKVDGPKIIITFASDLGKAYLEICFDR
ncbi:MULTISPECIES: chemotaxis protein CheX [Alteromonadaceae]|jgi:chemotaxis protein CheX|uniref:Chemotaxis protein CheX n=1 Tax=Brumicola blandensis TaxID=3075611 RepID=A0AAW8R2U1_9ALTE|nr:MULTISPECIES: chemotaxis protein CheX [unclassified Alteromonas]MDT0583502.1 chemotaxis protein CheX [Alteromonas sp. W409]MDT0629437.1 chemotaxis protein CheX [Alteromonas sp. W364]